MTVLNCSDFPDFRGGAARTDMWHCSFSHDWKWRRQILCTQCTLHRVLFRRVNHYILTYTYCMLFEHQGWAKSASKNITKAYLNKHCYRTPCAFHIVPEQCSKCSWTVDGAAWRAPCVRVKMFGTIAEYPATYIFTV
jgi:hypothetical protein